MIVTLANALKFGIERKELKFLILHVTSQGPLNLGATLWHWGNVEKAT